MSSLWAKHDTGLYASSEEDSYDSEDDGPTPRGQITNRRPENIRVPDIVNPPPIFDPANLPLPRPIRNPAIPVVATRQTRAAEALTLLRATVAGPATNPNRVEQILALTKAANFNPLKRRRAPDDNGDSTSSESDADSLLVNYNVPNPNRRVLGQPPLRRLGPATAHVAQVPVSEDLKKITALQLDFLPHPDEDRSDAWFQQVYGSLFVQLQTFVKLFFGFIDLSSGAFEPWALNHTPEFLMYVELVAEADPSVGGWNDLVKNTEQRQHLIMGILVRILEVKVFSESLWGANQEGQELLLGLERALLSHEGFSRTALRSATVRTIVGNAPTTERFHPEVARLTAQVMLLFKPLVDYMHAIPPPPGVVVPSIKHHYQALHNIIAQAAYLSICIRLSPTIFHTSHLSPGANYEDEEQHSMSPPIWAASKNAVLRVWKKKKAPYEEARRIAVEAVELNKPLVTDHPVRIRAEAALQAANRALHDLKGPTQTHRAMVKIAVWPNVRRYSPGSGEEGGEEDGFRILSLTYAGALYYYGEQGRAPAQKEKLLEFVKEKQKRYGSGSATSTALQYVAAGVAAAGGALIYSNLDAIVNFVGNVV